MTPDPLAALRKQHYRVENVTQDGDDWTGCVCGEPDDDCAVLAYLAAPTDSLDAALRDAAAAVALDYHSLAISGDDQDEDGNLHPAVTWARCTAPKCVALRSALQERAG